MDPDDAADIIGDLPYDKAEALLRLMGVKESSAIRSLLGYKEKTAGGIMTPECTTVTDDMTVQQVIDQLRDEADEQESMYYVYVVEANRRLAGVISLRDLLLASPGTTVAEIAERDLFVSHVDDDQEDVAEQMSKYDLLALPVIDEAGKLLGIVTVDDALDVLEEESAEDLALATGSAEHGGPVASMLWWLLRRNAWILVWTIVAFAVVAGTPRFFPDLGDAAIFILPAVLLLPLLLRTAEDISQRAIAEMIEDVEEGGGSLSRHLLRDTAVRLRARRARRAASSSVSANCSASGSRCRPCSRVTTGALGHARHGRRRGRHRVRAPPHDGRQARLGDGARYRDDAARDGALPRARARCRRRRSPST